MLPTYKILNSRRVKLSTIFEIRGITSLGKSRGGVHRRAYTLGTVSTAMALRRIAIV